MNRDKRPRHTGETARATRAAPIRERLADLGDEIVRRVRSRGGRQRCLDDIDALVLCAIDESLSRFEAVNVAMSQLDRAAVYGEAAGSWGEAGTWRGTAMSFTGADDGPVLANMIITAGATVLFEALAHHLADGPPDPDQEWSVGGGLIEGICRVADELDVHAERIDRAVLALGAHERLSVAPSMRRAADQLRSSAREYVDLMLDPDDPAPLEWSDLLVAGNSALLMPRHSDFALRPLLPQGELDLLSAATDVYGHLMMLGESVHPNSFALSAFFDEEQLASISLPGRSHAEHVLLEVGRVIEGPTGHGPLAPANPTTAARRRVPGLWRDELPELVSGLEQISDDLGRLRARVTAEMPSPFDAYLQADGGAGPVVL